MSGTSNLDWMWYASGVALAILGLTLAYWALLHDRARGRKRCPKCWYDMTGAEAGAGGAYFCPECGKLIVKKRKLRKTHRRWGWGMLAIVMIIASTIIGPWPKLRNDGWTAYVPKSLLVRVAPLSPHSRIGLALENQLFTDVFFNDALSNAHLEVLLDRAVNADGEFGIAFSCRDAWPRDLPLILESQLSFLWIINRKRALSMWTRIRTPEHDWSKFSKPSHGLPTTTEIRLPAEGDRCDIEVEIREGDEVIWRSESISIRLVDSAEEILKPVHDPAIDALITDVFSPKLLADDAVPSSSVMLSQFGYQLNEEQSRLCWQAIWGFSVEIRNREHTVATGQALISLDTVFGGPTSSRIVELEWDIEALRAACDDPNSQWRIVVRGDPSVALADLDRDRYWAGELEFEFNWIEIERWCLDNDAY